VLQPSDLTTTSLGRIKLADLETIGKNGDTAIKLLPRQAPAVVLAGQQSALNDLLKFNLPLIAHLPSVRHPALDRSTG
jgi:hypothetical protein